MGNQGKGSAGNFALDRARAEAAGRKGGLKSAAARAQRKEAAP